MALSDWPDSLNYLAQKGTFTHKLGDPNVRTDFDSGPSRYRKRFTSVSDVYTFQVLMTSFEKLLFDGFYKNIINFGTDWFNMPVVIDNDYSTKIVRISKEGIAWNDAGYDKFMLSLSLEIRNINSLDALSVYILGYFGSTEVVDNTDLIINTKYPHAVAGAKSAIA